MFSACLAACAPSIDPRPIVVAPGVGGEWDDPSAAGSFRDITGTIQEAVDAASPGDIITVQSGTFAEDVVITEGITLVGAGAGETIVEGTIWMIGVDGASLGRMSVVNPGDPYVGDGVLVEYSTSVLLEELEVSGFNWGMRSYANDNLEVNANVGQFNNYGFWSDETTDLVVRNNMFRSNGISGVTNYTSTGIVAYNTLVGNAFAGSAEFEFGGALQFGGLDETEVVANNIVVSNFYGINCQECGNTFTNNLVWGNATNYINDASQMGDDITVDPVFTNPSEFDYSLTVSSPAIDDANGAWPTDNDASGNPRPSGRGYDIGMYEYTVSSYDLRITEVMANAAVETVGEFIELYNYGELTIDLSGLVVTDGDDVDTLMAFDGGPSTLPPESYAVIVDPDYDGSYDIPEGTTVMTTMDTNVGNGLTTSDMVELLEPDGETTIATFGYPKDPGDGISMEMFNLELGDLSGNWRGSECVTGESAGEPHCFPPSGDPMGLIITEILANAADEGTGEYVELFNPTDTVIDAAGLVISDGDSSDPLRGFANSSTLIGAGAHALIVDPGYPYDYYLPNGITMLTTDDLSIGDALATTDPVYLYLGDGTTLIDSFESPSNPGDGISIEKVDYEAGDSPDNWLPTDDTCARGLTPGVLNASAGGICDALIITEVMSNAVVEDTGEFVEIMNAGTAPIVLAGLRLTDGTHWDTLTAYDGGTTLLEAGARALILDAEYAGEYALPADLVLVTTEDTHLGNGFAIDDEIRLYEGDYLLDAYHFPFNAGNGISVERIRDRATDAQENWVAAPCGSGSSPGVANCATGGDAGGSGTSEFTLVITEVLANALDEDLGEFIEIYNYGEDPINLELFQIYDSDAVDLIFGWWYPDETILMPGQIGVILDNEYDYSYDIPEDALMLTTGDTTLGSGLSTEDPISLLEPDGVTLIDSFSFPWNPGNGTSIEKVDALGGDLLSNWRASACTEGSSPGAPACF